MCNPLLLIWHYILNILYSRIKERLRQDELQERNSKLLKVQHSFKHFGKGSIFVYDDYVINGAKYIYIGNNFFALHHLRLEAIDFYAGQQFSPSIFIGDNSSVQDSCHIGCIEKVEIGNGVLIASNVLITDHFHGQTDENDLKYPPIERPLTSKPVKIGDNVWIGNGVCIMPGVTIGDNVIIGANSVVTHSFPNNTVIAGCPAKIIKKIINTSSI